MDMKGKVCLVTGANSGIGLAASRSLAGKGALVVMACRDRARGEEAARSAGGAAELLVLDMASLDSVREAAKSFSSRHPALHVLINNAGVWTNKRRTTREGFETTFGVNHLGHFLLTNLLLENLKKGAPSRVVNVSSGAHQGARLDWSDLQLERRYSGWTAYANSKLANILFTRALARRLPPSVTANAVHPGVIQTGIFREMPGFLRGAMGLFLATPEKGAEPLVRLACAEDVEGVTGRYFDKLKETKPSAAALDDAAAERLWELSARLAGFVDA